jgi:hypothetical protein
MPTTDLVYAERDDIEDAEVTTEIETYEAITKPLPVAHNAWSEFNVCSRQRHQSISSK